MPITIPIVAGHTLDSVHRRFDLGSFSTASTSPLSPCCRILFPVRIRRVFCGEASFLRSVWCTGVVGTTGSGQSLRAAISRCRQSKPGSLFFPNLRPASWFARHPKPESWFSRCRCENPAFQLLLGPEQKKASAAQSNCQKLTFLLLA